MCGIAGFWKTDEDRSNGLTVARAMTGCLQHRGPDADGQWQSAEHGVVLGHRRLSIVDLSPTGAQPMHSQSARFSIVFNGEVYNFRALRAELEAVGTHFIGTSDTEVMLAAFERHGVEASVARFHGMFAFAVWDNLDQCLWLCRDRLGEKPLYITQFDRTFGFASELKAFRQLPGFPTDVDERAIADVLQRGFVRHGRTIYRSAKQLLPGELARVSIAGSSFDVKRTRYWSIPDVMTRVSTADVASDEGAVDALHDLLLDVVRDEVVADVPVGAFLSGGIDSSLVVALMQGVSNHRVRSFTIGFTESQFDESPYARAVAEHLGTEHTEVILSADDALQYVERLPTIFDEPFADSSQLPTLLVSATTRRFVTVALSGDGGDELFGGYSQYQGRDSVRSVVDRIPGMLRQPLALGVRAAPARALQRAGSTNWHVNTKSRWLAELSSSDPSRAYDALLSMWTSPGNLLTHSRWQRANASNGSVPWPRASSRAESQMAYDMQTYLPEDILVKVDRSAMACSLETRAPFLDHRVVEFALRQPLHRKIRDGKGKFLLRRLLARYIPDQLIDRPKRGFAIPLDEWLRGPLRTWAEDLLKPDELLLEWFQYQVLERLWQEQLRGGRRAQQLWPALMILQWLRHNTTR